MRYLVDIGEGQLVVYAKSHTQAEQAVIEALDELNVGYTPNKRKVKLDWNWHETPEVEATEFD